MQILTNPKRGSRDAFAVTQHGVYYKSDTSDTQPWQRITGNLFAITTPVFGSTDPNNQVQAIRTLNTIAVASTRPRAESSGTSSVARTSG